MRKYQTEMVREVGRREPDFIFEDKLDFLTLVGVYEKRNSSSKIRIKHKWKIRHFRIMLTHFVSI